MSVRAKRSDPRTCTKCGETKTNADFRKRKGAADGLHRWCKTCCVDYGKAHYLENKDRYLESHRNYVSANSEDLQEYKKAWYQLRGRDKQLQKLFGITLEEYEKLLDSQGGGCAICHKTPEENGRNLAVDHSHITGVIRGLLCTFCNKFVVSNHSDGNLLRKAGEYLETADTGYVVPTEYLKGPKKRRRTRKVVSEQ